MPFSKQKKAVDEFFTRLVSPEELVDKNPSVTSVPKKKPAPLIKPRSTPQASEIDKGSKYLPQKESTEEKSITDKGSFGKADIQKGKFDSHLPPSMPAPSLREKLFDEGVIGDLAKRDIKKETKKAKTFTFDAKEYKFLIYNNRLKERIESIWIYPPEAAVKGIYGDLVIRFSIMKNGRLGEIQILRTSGYKHLDDAAIKALKDGEPYWPLPDEWGMETYTIIGHFIYTIYGYYVR